MTTDKKLRFLLEQAISSEFGPDLSAELLQLLDGVEPKEDLWTARGIKSNLAELITEAQQGEPQLIKRSIDELPVLVISLRSVVEHFQPRNQVSFWEHMRKGMRPVKPLPALKDLPLESLTLPRHAARVAEA